MPPKSSPTAQETPDPLGLGTGSTSGQRGAEILAGARAELDPNPITKALATLPGIVGARLLLRLETSQAARNFVIGRLKAMPELLKRHLDITEENTIVEIASGMAPRGVQMALEYPNLTIIEVDLPGVLNDKRSRLEKNGVAIPDNLKFLPADLGVTPLHEVLKDEKVDGAMADGLLSYFPHDEMIRIAEAVRYSLKPGGVFTCDIGWEPGIKAGQSVSRIFSRQAGKFAGLVKQEQHAEDILKKAGFTEVAVHHPTKLAEELDTVDGPILEFSLWTVSVNGESEPT